jgi:hypothetical protein
VSARPDDESLGKAYTAGEITVYYDRARCRHYAECVRGLPDVFDPSLCVPGTRFRRFGGMAVRSVS